MRRLAVVVGCCVAGGACAVPAVADQAPPPPRPPKPVSLTIRKVNRSLIVVVKCKHLTRKNARHNTDNLVLEVHTFRPRGGYGVQSNGPGMPVAVHPYAGPEGSASGPATLKI